MIAPVEALSGTSSFRRPPRIRPKRQSPTTLPSSDNTQSRASTNSSRRSENGKVADHSTNANENENSQDEIRGRRHEQALRDPSLLTSIRFADRTDMHPHTREALKEGFGLQTMTRVQAETYVAALDGRSVLARSKTGSGKTLAFLLPTLERLLDPDLGLYVPGRSIGCVILAPTRELAIQIADQAEILVGFHNKHRHGRKSLSVACIYGELHFRFLVWRGWISAYSIILVCLVDIFFGLLPCVGERRTNRHFQIIIIFIPLLISNNRWRKDATGRTIADG